MKKWIKKPLMPIIVLIIICMSIFAAAHGELIVQRSEPMIEIMGKEVKLETYNINGNNYVKLRDFSEAMGMYVDWDGEKGKITISDTPLIDNDKYIIIDAGHGGYETGAKNDDLGLIEKDVNLNVAVKLAKMLESSGYRVKLTRSDDMTLVLEERMEQIVREKPDLYVSVHHNASEEVCKCSTLRLT